MAVWLEGRVLRWHDEQPVFAVVCLCSVHVDVDVWQSSHVVGYVAGSAVCEAGRLLRWQLPQFVDVLRCLVAVQLG